MRDRSRYVQQYFLSHFWVQTLVFFNYLWIVEIVWVNSTIFLIEDSSSESVFAKFETDDQLIEEWVLLVVDDLTTREFLWVINSDDSKNDVKFVFKLRKSLLVHSSDLHVHSFSLHVHLLSKNLKFSLHITQLHIKFSRQFKSLHIISSNFFTVILHCLKNFNIIISASFLLHMKRCKQICIHLNEKECDSMFILLLFISLLFISLLFIFCLCETSISILLLLLLLSLLLFHSLL